jgi:hypothetical protein
MEYDLEANILSWELAKGEISHAREFGNFIIHFSPAGKKPPVGGNRDESIHDMGCYPKHGVLAVELRQSPFKLVRR